MSTATVSASSYCVAVLHAAAHPACPCTGVLLGRVANGAAVSVVSSLPLLHTPLGVSTQLEVALLQAEAFAASQSLVLVGVYHAPAHAATTTVPPAVIKIADKLQSVTGSAVVLLLDAAAFEIAASEKPMPCFQARAPTATVAYCTCVLTRETQLFVRDAGRWRASSSALPLDSNAPALLASYLQEGRERRVADWQQHTHDLHLNWLNPDLLS